jgi:hypothetical protein
LIVVGVDGRSLMGDEGGLGGGDLDP